MREKTRHAWWLSLGLLAACDSPAPDQSQGALGALRSGEEFAEEEFPPSDDEDEGDSDPPPALDCPQGGETGPISVTFACDEITVVTCKDLSNVVLELDDGEHHKVEGLQGHTNRFEAPEGQTIVGVWVKSGTNHSGDGPGYGEKFEAPADSCDPTDEPDDETPPGEDPPTAEEPPSDEVDLD